MNSYGLKIGINGALVDYTKYCILAPKWGQLLDERLDEGYIDLKYTPIETPFQPLTYCELSIKNTGNTPVFHKKPAVDGITQALDENGYLTQEKTIQFVVATDDVEEMPAGSGRYNHKLYVIEATKYAERLIGDTIVFGNATEQAYGENPAPLHVLYDYIYTDKTVKSDRYFLFKQKSNYFVIPTIVKIYNDESNSLNFPVYSGDISVRQALYNVLNSSLTECRLRISDIGNNNAQLFEKYYSKDAGSPNYGLAMFDNDTISIPVSSLSNFGEGALKVEYFTAPSSSAQDTVPPPVTLSYTYIIYDRKYPPKKWTVTDAVIRCCELIEPLRATFGENGLFNATKPRFIFNGVQYEEIPVHGGVVIQTGIRLSTYEAGSQAAYYDKIILPTMALAKCTFREQLQQIGKIVHAEPRLVSSYDNGTLTFTIYYDEYGQRDYAAIADKPYIEYTAKQDINEYATNLDSNVDNFVNTFSDATGTLVEPYDGGVKSLRTDSATLRFSEDDNTFFATIEPIYKLEKVEAAAQSDGNGNFNELSDITSFIFESADYANLSTFEGGYPNCASYALKYTQGEKNITGLFFKKPNALSTSWLGVYAIKNILQACGQRVYEDVISGTTYYNIRYQITYRPVFSQRVTQAKTDIGYNASTLAYNQGANLVETRFYGENLRGVIARLGNIEKTRTYLVGYLTDIPKAGQLFDKDYYISAVTTEVTPNYFKVTLGLSKDFNRLSQYVGINSEMRMWEVSEKQSQNRDSVYKETLLLTDNNVVSNVDTLARTGTCVIQGEDIDHPDGVLASLYNQFFGDFEDVATLRISTAIAYGRLKNGTPIKNYAACLPVITTAFGNSMTFNFKFADNYSAGQKAVKTGEGWYGKYVPYCDYFGRFYWLSFGLMQKPDGGQFASGANIPELLPQTNGVMGSGLQYANIMNGSVVSTVTAGNTPLDKAICYRKNGEEIPRITYQLDIKTDSGYIIGGGFARNCSLVGGYYEGKLKLVFFRYELPKFITQLSQKDIANKIEFNGVSLVPSLNAETGAITYLKINDVSLSSVPQPDTFKAWAVVTPSNTQTLTVSDENGNTTTQTVENGYEVLFARNGNFAAGSTIKMPRIVIKKELF